MTCLFSKFKLSKRKRKAEAPQPSADVKDKLEEGKELHSPLQAMWRNKTQRSSQTSRGSRLRTYYKLVPQKDSSHGRSTLIPWWPLLQTLACPGVISQKRYAAPSTSQICDWDPFLGTSQIYVQDTLSEAVVKLRTVVMFVTWLGLFRKSTMSRNWPHFSLRPQHQIGYLTLWLRLLPWNWWEWKLVVWPRDGMVEETLRGCQGESSNPRIPSHPV